MAIPVPTIKTAAVAAAAMSGAGGLGGNTWSSNLSLGGFGGAVFPYAASRLAMGGGGGSGARNNSTGVQSSGGQGGGLIIVRANSITGTATLSANGGVGVTPANDGGGGGGAGGSVLVFARTGVLTSSDHHRQGCQWNECRPDWFRAWPRRRWRGRRDLPFQRRRFHQRHWRR